MAPYGNKLKILFVLFYLSLHGAVLSTIDMYHTWSDDLCILSTNVRDPSVELL